MRNLLRTLGQIFIGMGVTLFVGGIASLIFDKVELRFLGDMVTDTNGKIVWIVVTALFASAGYALMWFSKSKENSTKT